MTDLQKTYNWMAAASKLVDPEREAHLKALDELNIDEAVIYRPTEFFPRDDDKRTYKVAARVDGNYRRALKIISRAHPRTVRGNNQFIALALGSLKLAKIYAVEIAGISHRFDKIESGSDIFLYDRSQKRSSISQVGPVTQIQIGLTMQGQNAFEDLAEALGLSISSLIVVCFWISAISSACLPIHLTEYGFDIQNQFGKHLKSRAHELDFSI